jgi:hypothetical protein
MNSLWPYVAITLATGILALFLAAFKKKPALFAIGIPFILMSLYYMQGPDDLLFIQTWGTRLGLLIYLAVFSYLLVVYRRGK